MARTIQEIYNDMASQKQAMTSLNDLQPNVDSAQTLLNDLTTPSRVARWRLIFFNIAVAIFSLEKLFDFHKEWIEQRTLEIETGTLPWYQAKSLEFQYGDSIQWNGKNYQYSAINVAAKIVKLCSVREVGSSVLLKIAKLSGTTAQELTPSEKLAFQYYINQVKFAGVKLVIVSRPADFIKLQYKVYYNPLLLNSIGEAISTPGTFPVRDAVNEYLLRMPFDGILSITGLTDAIQQAIGVVNPVHIASEAKFGALPYQTINDYYQADAGHMIVDPLFPLSSSIQYISANV